MASIDHILLLRHNLAGLRVPHVLLVRVWTSASLCVFAQRDPYFDSMRYSRMLEESSFANRKADYFWLLFLSSLMLLVCRITRPTRFISQRTPLAGSLTTREPAIPLFAAGFRPHLPVVSAPPQYTNIAIRSHHDHRSILASGSCWARMDVEWHLASSGW